MSNVPIIYVLRYASDCLFNSDYFYSKLINFAVPETIDDRAINTGKKVSLFKKHENLSLAINSAKVFR